MTKFHSTQTTYFQAKALFETLAAERRERMKAFDHLLENEKDFEEHANQAVALDAELGYWDTLSLLRQAEDEMIKWAVGKVRKIKQARGKQDVMDHLLEAAIVKRNPTARIKMVDLSAKLID